MRGVEKRFFISLCFFLISWISRGEIYMWGVFVRGVEKRFFISLCFFISWISRGKFTCGEYSCVEWKSVDNGSDIGAGLSRDSLSHSQACEGLLPQPPMSARILS